MYVENYVMNYVVNYVMYFENYVMKYVVNYVMLLTCVAILCDHICLHSVIIFWVKLKSGRVAPLPTALPPTVRSHWWWRYPPLKKVRPLSSTHFG